jgi:integrase
VQKKLACTPRVTSRSKDARRATTKFRSRKGVNETIRNVIAFFAFCEQLEEIPPGKTAQLRIVNPLKKNTSLPVVACKRKSRVDDAVLAATLPHLPESVADMVRLARRLGCRPSEIRAMTLADIDRRPLAEYKGCWIWRPSKFKVDWLEDPLPRQIAIEPASQGILAPWVAQVERTPHVPVFSPMRPLREHCRRRATDAVRCRPAHRHRKRNNFYSKELFQSEIDRGAAKAGVEHWTAGQIRHTRLQEARDNGGIEAAQAVGGHSNINQTEHYAGILLGTAINAALSIASPEL